MGFSCSEACGIFLDQGLNLCLLSHQGNPWTFLSWVTIQPSTACLARYLPVSEDLLALSPSSFLHTHIYTTDHKCHKSRTLCFSEPQLHAESKVDAPYTFADGRMDEQVNPRRGWYPNIIHGNHLLQLFKVAMPLGGCLWVSRDWEGPPRYIEVSFSRAYRQEKLFLFPHMSLSQHKDLMCVNSVLMIMVSNVIL